MLHTRATSLSLLLCLSACADEVVTPVAEGEATTCAGPTWTYEHHLGFTRWSDNGGAAAESGDVVLVAWQERDENTGDTDEVHGRFLDAATGEPRGELEPMRTGSFSDVWVRAIDSGFLVFVRASFDIAVFHVPFDARGFDAIGRHPRGDLGFAAVETAAGVLAFADREVLHFDHDGLLRNRWRTGVAAETICETASTLPDGRVVAWCNDATTGGDVWVTLDADGDNAVGTPMGTTHEWPPVMAASDAGVFMLLPIDEQAVHLAVFDEEGRPRAAPVPVRLRTVDEGDIRIMGVTTCTATCEGLSLVARGNQALFEVMTLPGHAERFAVTLDDDDTLTMSHRGAREVMARQTLTGTATGPLSTSVRPAPTVPFLDLWPPQIVVVDRPCLRVADEDS